MNEINQAAWNLIIVDSDAEEDQTEGSNESGSDEKGSSSDESDQEVGFEILYPEDNTLRLCRTTKGRTAVADSEGYIYVHHKPRKGHKKFIYRCAKYNMCNVRLHVDEDENGVKFISNRMNFPNLQLVNFTY